jgi:hypothetical protein
MGSKALASASVDAKTVHENIITSDSRFKIEFTMGAEVRTRYSRNTRGVPPI